MVVYAMFINNKAGGLIFQTVYHYCNMCLLLNTATRIPELWGRGHEGQNERLPTACVNIRLHVRITQCIRRLKHTSVPGMP